MTEIYRPAWDSDPLVARMTACNPLSGNPLRSRDDLARAVRDLHAPLRPWYSPGGARLRLGAASAHYANAAAEMEGFVRPLWGIAPLVAGGADFADTSRYVRGLAHGMDREHPEYWGDVGPFDQRMVEMAGIATAMLLARETFWDPMPEAARERAARWLLSINDFAMPDNNWLFFRVLTNLALRHVGQEWSEGAVRAALDRMDSYYLGGGWYRDGQWGQRDYYVPMALHFYGLMVAEIAGDLFPEHAARYRARAREFAQGFQHWFADDGAAIPFGRSMTYRFAQGAFWAGCAFAGEEVLPWGRIKGLLLRHLRWWAERPICDRDGVLSVGYAYPDLLMSEGYNAPGSPYWALKSFIVLALPQDHPFWTAEEETPEALPKGVVLAPAAGFAMRRAPGDTVMLTGGQNGHEHRGRDAKYARFAYSSAFPVSVNSDATAPEHADRSAVDCGLMLSRDGRVWLSRSEITEAGMDGGMAWGRWQPDERLSVESWLAFAGRGWHMRVHRVRSDVPLWLAESGFSLDRTGEERPGFAAGLLSERGRAVIRTSAATSAILDLAGDRTGEIVRAAPNTNLRFPRTLFPRLTGELPAGDSVIASAVYAVTRPVVDLPPIAVPQEMRALAARFGLPLD